MTEILGEKPNGRAGRLRAAAGEAITIYTNQGLEASLNITAQTLSRSMGPHVGVACSFLCFEGSSGDEITTNLSNFEACLNEQLI